MLDSIYVATLPTTHLLKGAKIYNQHYDEVEREILWHKTQTAVKINYHLKKEKILLKQGKKRKYQIRFY